MDCKLGSVKSKSIVDELQIVDGFGYGGRHEVAFSGEAISIGFVVDDDEKSVDSRC